MRRLALALLLLPLAVRAQADDPEAVRAVLGPALAVAGLDASLALMEAEVGADLDPEAVRADVVGWLAARTPLDTARAFAAWTVRADVAPFLAWERETASGAFEDRLSAFRAETGPLDEGRLLWTDAFLARTGYLDYATEMSLVGYAVLFAAVEAEEAGRPLTPKEEAELAEEVRAELYADTREGVEAELYDVYYLAFEDATVAQRDAYLDAVGAPEAQWYFRQMPRAMTAAFEDLMRRLLAEE